MVARMCGTKRWTTAFLWACFLAGGESASKTDPQRRRTGGTASEACPAGVEVRWMKPTRSSVYATPLITDFFGDGSKSIVVPSFHRYLEVIRGSTGEELPGWPAEHPSDVHASPLLYDVDEDGVLDVLLATYEGHVLAFKDNGERMKDRSFRLPSLKVKEGWYVGLRKDHVDRQDPDVGRRDTHTGDAGAALLSEEDIAKALHEEARGERESVVDRKARSLLQADVQVEPGKHQLSEEAAKSFEVFDELDDEREVDEVGEIHEDEEGMFEGLEEDAAYYEEDEYEEETGWTGRRDGMDVDDDLWDEDWWDDYSPVLEDGQVKIDPHVLCTPALGDVDGDGRLELVVALSHFFDRERYDNPLHAWRLEGVQASKYVASSLLVYDLANGTVKWHQHLDLSTDETFYRAYAYSAPTLVDLDLDGTLEIVLGTSMGFLYVLNADGSTRTGWPKQMGEIQAQVVAVDVDLDGRIELLASDTSGDVVAFRGSDGERLWERHVNGMVSQAVSVADVDGDGALEVVLGTSTGHIHVLRGVDGRPVPPFPFRARGRIAAPVLPVKLLEDRPSLHLVVLAFDGILYLVDGATGCADVRDLGETSYSMVLAEDLDEDGRMDLVVTTMNGNVYLLDTSIPAHPLQSTTGLPFVFRHQWYGVHVLEGTPSVVEVGTRRLTVRFRIVDRRPSSTGNASTSPWGPYRIRASLHARATSPVLGSPTWHTTGEGTYVAPGVYSITLSVPGHRATGRLVLTLLDLHHTSTWDGRLLVFHARPTRLWKWLYAGPSLVLWASALPWTLGRPPTLPRST